MDESIFVLLGLGALGLLIIGFITVLGWFAKLFGLGSSAPVAVKLAEPALACTACGTALQPVDLFCIGCGAPTPTAAHQRTADLQATKRVLQRLRQAGRIDETSYQQVWQALETEAQQAAGSPAQAPEPAIYSAQPVLESVPPAPVEALPVITAAAAPISPVTAKPAPEPRRTFTEMLASFMEESSIRWGELIGGLLIIGSSLALVVSLWSQIAERPVLKFGVFMTLIAGLFGLGFYSAHRWKLPTTSRGVLLTAMMLVPLNFLAVAAFGRTSAASAGILLAEAASWLMLAALVWLAARVIAAEQQQWLTLGTLWASLALLLAKHLAASGAGGGLNWRSWLLLGALPVLGYVVSVGAAVRAARQSEEIQAARVYGLFTVLGVNLFAVLLPLGLLQVRAENWTRALHENAPLVALLGIPAVALGWLLWRRLRATELAGERTVAASLGLSGVALLVGSALLAFPFVDALIVIALLNVALFGWAAWRYELRAARWLALAQAVWAYALLGQMTLGRLTFGMEDGRRLLASVLSYSSSVALLAAFAILYGLAEWWRERAAEDETRTARAQDYAWAAGLVGLFSLLLATLHGFAVVGDPKRLAWVFGFYALAAFVWAWRRTFWPGVWLGWLLLLGASAQTCVYKYGWLQNWRHAWIVSWLVLAVAASLTSLASVWRSEKAQRLLCRPGLQVAWGSALWASVAMLADSRGLNGWYIAPLVLVSAACVVYAWRCETGTSAWAGGLLLNAAVTVGYAMWVENQGGLIRGHEWARLVQLNLLTGAGYALGWLRAARAVDAAWLRWQVRALTGALLGLLSLLALSLGWLTVWPSEFARTVGDGLGWAAWLAVATCFVYTRQNARTLPCVRNVALTMLSLGVLLACTLQRFAPENWLSYHTLLAMTVVTAWAMLWLVLLARREAQFTVGHNRVRARLTEWLNALLAQSKTTADSATLWAICLSVATVWLSLLDFNAPGGPWRGVVALAGVAALSIGLAVARRSHSYFYAAGLLTCLALTEWIFGYSKGPGTLLDVALLNVTALAAVALLSLWLELKVLRTTAEARTSVPAFHQFAAVLLLLLTCLKVVVGLSLDFNGAQPLPVKGWIAGAALASVMTLCLACLWDALFAYRFAVLFIAGLATVAALVDRQNLSAQFLLVAAALTLTGYALAVALVWRQRAKLVVALRGWRLPRLVEAANASAVWLLYAETGLAAGAVLAALSSSWAVVSWPQRMLAASVALLAPLAVGWLTPIGGVAPEQVAPPTEGHSPSAPLAAAPQGRLQTGYRQWGQMVALVLELGAMTAWLWVALNLPGYAQDANRAVTLLALTLTLALTFFGTRAAEFVVWPRALGAWESATRRVLFGAGLFGLGLLALLLFFEWAQTNDIGYVPLGWWAKAALTICLLALCVVSVAFALWRGRDPFELRAEQRGRYVYAAEILAVLLLAHLRLSAPWLFGGMFKQYWPLAVLALAFAGVGVAEQLRRRGRVVLAEPLARTGVFLPLLPSLGFWLLESRVDYAGLLLLVGLFYGLLSVMRRSFGFGLLAALAANGGWWHWLQRTEDYGFLAHPQVWLIPAALSVLAAAHLNREQLTREQMAAFRYAALITIYVSSTADIFIHGVGASAWLPLMLAVLSVAGVLLGMLLQVRAYLFLGTAFLLLAVITMVWHAALSLGWGWLWYVSGIAFGIFILYLFALFERRRAELIGLMERLKTWEA
ncbi:MAG: hypothetical protein HYR56_01585 [Acidobacteria bacterium]|nr:hypothetical protein [Acidobacteriota bacterium]